MQNGVKFSEDREGLVACLFGEIDHHAAKGQREKIDDMLFKLRPKALTLDFSEVKFMDSSGIGLIIGRAGVCEEIGCELRLIGMSAGLKKIVRLSGIQKIKGLTVVG